MTADGAFADDPDGLKEWLGILGDLVSNLSRTLIGLSAVTVEKIWNGIVDKIWDALGNATGLALPRPQL